MLRTFSGENSFGGKIQTKGGMKVRRLAVSSSCALLLCFLIPAPSHAGTVTYGYQTVISPGDPNFDQLLGINNASTIAGYYGDGVVCAGINRQEAEDENSSRERSSDPLGPEFCAGHREVHSEA